MCHKGKMLGLAIRSHADFPAEVQLLSVTGSCQQAFV
jgi:hypothetical protein